jgi:3-dehydroquinate synthase
METTPCTARCESRYDILLGHDILKETVGRLTRLRLNRRCVVITNEVVAKWYLQPLVAELRSRGFTATELVLPDGEEHKSFATIQDLIPKLVEAECERDTPILTLGGGVIGDLGGFLAAIYKRGAPLIHLPTTLLAMVDASIGGKVGVNLPQGKNLIGAFHQPTLVAIDVGVLRTLPLTQVSYGLVEAIKHGAIADPAYFKFISRSREAIKSRDLGVLQRLVRRSIHLKKQFVEDDPHERGDRALLNFGHTFGHAFEVLGAYRRLHHGEAVGLGMLVALSAARRLGVLAEDYTESLTELLADLNLPVSVPREWNPADIARIMIQDKKRQQDKIPLVLPKRLGEVVLHPLALADLDPLLQEILANRRG